MRKLCSTLVIMLGLLLIGGVILPGCGGSGANNSAIKITLTDPSANSLVLTVSPNSGSAADPLACSDTSGPVWCTRSLAAGSKEFTFTTDSALVPYFLYVTNTTGVVINNANLRIEVDGQVVMNVTLSALPTGNVPVQYATIFRNNVSP